MECIICYDDINIDDCVILECCNNHVHIICLQKWLQQNINKNTELDKCFMCKNSNEFIKNLLPNNIQCDEYNYLSDSSNNSSVIIQIHDNNNNNNNNNNINNNIIISRNNYRYRKYIICNIFIYACFIYAISYIIYTFIEKKNDNDIIKNIHKI